MGSHAYHDVLPGFNPNAILHDGCDECESRAGIRGLGFLDRRNSRRVVERAVAYGGGGLSDTNPTEIKLLRDVWAVLVWLENNTELKPIESGLPWVDFGAMERAAFGGGGRDG